MVKVVDVDTTVDELSTAVVDNNEGIVTDDAVNVVDDMLLL